MGWERRVEVGVCGVGEEESEGGSVWGTQALGGGREKRRPGTRLERRSKAGRFGGHRIKQFT